MDDDLTEDDHLYGDDICQGCLMRVDLCECADATP